MRKTHSTQRVRREVVRREVHENGLQTKQTHNERSREGKTAKKTARTRNVTKKSEKEGEKVLPNRG